MVVYRGTSRFTLLWWAVVVGEVGLDALQWGEYVLDVVDLLRGELLFLW